MKIYEVKRLEESKFNKIIYAKENLIKQTGMTGSIVDNKSDSASATSHSHSQIGSLVSYSINYMDKRIRPND